MIIVDRNKGVMIKGTKLELMSECTMIMNELLEQGVATKDDLLFLVELSTKTPEELHKGLEKERAELLKKLMGEETELLNRVERMLKEMEEKK